MNEVAAGMVAGSSRVRLHPLQMRADGESWIVGRVETGEFIAIPAAGHRAITLLSGGATVDNVCAQLREETGSDIDIAGFVTSLAGLGFVAQLDGRTLATLSPPPPTFRWLRSGHVRWVLHPALALAVVTIVLAAIAATLADPTLMPSYRNLLWSGSGGLVVLGNAAIGWTLIFLHELAHLVTARAAGVPGRMSLSTRLQFLAAQTDVSGVWAAPRRTRLTVYLAGMAFNLVFFAMSVLLLATVHPTGMVRGLTAAAGLIALTFLPFQFLVFMRTDLYFVLQDLAGCANLYADGSAYARYLANRYWSLLSRRGHPSSDPSRMLPSRERRAVRAYTLLLVAGTFTCLATAVTVTLPVTITLVGNAVGALLGDASAAELFDAAAVLTTAGLFLLLWTRAWWRRHGRRVRRLLRSREQPSEGR